MRLNRLARGLLIYWYPQPCPKGKTVNSTQFVYVVHWMQDGFPCIEVFATMDLCHAAMKAIELKHSCFARTDVYAVARTDVYTVRTTAYIP